MLALVLTHLGHRVRTVPDAGTALDRARQDQFDVLLTDIYLPNRNGWDFLAELRVRRISPPHIISMSAMHIDDARGPSKAAGCCAHLVKPFSVPELETIFQRVCTSGVQSPNLPPASCRRS